MKCEKKNIYIHINKRLIEKFEINCMRKRLKTMKINSPKIERGKSALKLKTKKKKNIKKKYCKRIKSIANHDHLGKNI